MGTKNLGPDVTGLSVNHYNTADDDGNILINNLVEAAPGTFKVWKLADVTGTDLPEPFIEYTTTTQLLGRKLSVKGSVDKNAIITVGLNNPMSSTFARWKVTNGILESQTPEKIFGQHKRSEIPYAEKTPLPQANIFPLFLSRPALLCRLSR